VVGAHLICDGLTWQRLNPINLTYSPRRPALLTARAYIFIFQTMWKHHTAFNRLGQYGNSEGGSPPSATAISCYLDHTTPLQNFTKKICLYISSFNWGSKYTLHTQELENKHKKPKNKQHRKTGNKPHVKPGLALGFSGLKSVRFNYSCDF